MSIGHELRPPTWPAAWPVSVRALSRSGRLGTKVAVSARPTIVAVSSRWTWRKRPSNCHSKPLPRSTPHASSRFTFFIRARIASGTRGRPSFMRSPFHSEVSAMTSSRVGAMLWAKVRYPGTGARQRARWEGEVSWPSDEGLRQWCAGTGQGWRPARAGLAGAEAWGMMDLAHGAVNGAPCGCTTSCCPGTGRAPQPCGRRSNRRWRV